MYCIKYDRANYRAIFTTAKVPKIDRDDEIIIRIVIAGVCGTDLHIIENKFDALDGVTLGHEMVGYIHETPQKCNKFNVGERVVVNPNASCFQCRLCKKGMYNFCEKGGLNATLGIFHDGGWAEYCKVPMSLVFKLSEYITYEQAVLCEPLSCIVHAVEKLKNLEIGSNILIIGAGIIGLLWCNLLHLLGHRHVLISEPNVTRQKTVENLNLGFKCMSWDEILLHKKNSSEWKVDFCVDCSGNAEAIQAAMDLLDCGSTLLIFGVSDPTKTIQVSPFKLFKNEITIMGTTISTHTSFQKAVAIMDSFAHKYITVERLAMKKYKLKEYEEALKTFYQGKYSKIIFEI